MFKLIREALQYPSHDQWSPDAAGSQLARAAKWRLFRASLAMSESISHAHVDCLCGSQLPMQIAYADCRCGNQLPILIADANYRLRAAADRWGQIEILAFQSRVVRRH